MCVSFTATYSPEDNKLRLYVSERLSDELYQRVKVVGFRWASKQELFVCPRWTPDAADICAELAGEIEPELMTMQERAEFKAERLAGIQSKRAVEAGRYAATAASLASTTNQPILAGHRSQRKAEKQVEQAERMGEKAKDAAQAVQYYGWRVRGVEQYAKHKTRADVRQRRVATLLKDLRMFQRNQAHAVKCAKLWLEISELTDDEKLKATTIHHCNIGFASGGKCPSGYWSELTDGKREARVTAQELAESWKRSSQSVTRRRWIEHTLNRLDYEQYEISLVVGETPRFAGDLTPAILQIFLREQGAIKPVAKHIECEQWEIQTPEVLPLHIGSGYSVERSADEWLDLMQELGHTVNTTPKRKPRTTTKGVPLINPTEEDAARLMAQWIADAETKNGGDFRRIHKREPVFRGVQTFSQRTVTAKSKGEYSPIRTEKLDANGEIVYLTYKNFEQVLSGVPVCRVRMTASDPTRNAAHYSPDSIVVVSDKPKKPLPLDWETIDAEQPAEA